MPSKESEWYEGEGGGDGEREEGRDEGDGSGASSLPGRGSGSLNCQEKGSSAFGDAGSDSNRSDSVASSTGDWDVSLFPALETSDKLIRKLEPEGEARLDVSRLLLGTIALPLDVDIFRRQRMMDIWKGIT